MSRFQQTVIFSVAIVAHIALYYLSQTFFLRATAFWPSLVASPASVLCGVVPGLAFGYFASNRPILGGFLIGVIASPIEQFLVSPSRTGNWLAPDVLALLSSLAAGTAIVCAVSAAAGAYVKHGTGPNNSFKPKPLRGSA